MCGIVGYVGKNDARTIIMDGLKRLEYRGYDSAGIALVRNGSIDIRKKVGEIANLEELLKQEMARGICFDSHTGIGHTRWATHGAPSDVNAHPHASEDGTVAIVHNGIIENFVEIKQRLIAEYNVKFKSETDSEVIAHLIAAHMKNYSTLEDAVYAATLEMRGAYALVVVSSKDPNKIVAVRKDAPLIAGIGKGENFIASDIPALMKHCKEIYLIENGEMVVVTADEIKIYDEERNPVQRDVFHVTWDADAAEKVRETENKVDRYEDKLGAYLVKLSGKNLTDADSKKVTMLLHVIGDVERISDHSVNIVDTAEEIHKKKISFSPEGTKEINKITAAVLEVLALTVDSLAESDMEKAREIEPLEQVIDKLRHRSKNNHIARLKSGDCTIELGFVFNDLLANLERVSDHCSNIGVSILQSSDSSIEMHDYLGHIKNDGDIEFLNKYDEFKRKYSF